MLLIWGVCSIIVLLWERNIASDNLITIALIFKKLLTSTHSMFLGCSSLQSINSSSFNTTNVEDMSYMFSYCSSLQSINLSSFNTTNVKNMFGMFNGCSSLKKENVKIGSYGKKILDQLKYIKE